MRNKYYKLKDINPPCLVLFEKHNGKGRPITHRFVFVNWINEKHDFICFHSYTGQAYESLDPNEMKILEIYPFDVDTLDFTRLSIEGDK